MKSVKNTVTNKVVFSGTLEQCEAYIRKNNQYQMNYSLLQIVGTKKYSYADICEIIWGCVPVDVEWAKGTNIYKSKELELQSI